MVTPLQVANLKMSLTPTGAQTLRSFIPAKHHEDMYKLTPPFNEVHYQLPSSDRDNPIYIGRNKDGRYYLLTKEPENSDRTYNTFYGDINMTNFSPGAIEHTLSLLAFTIVACELMKVSDFKEKGELVRYIEGNLELHVNVELGRLSPERASYLTSLYLSSGQPNDWPMWSVPDKDSPEFKTVLMQDDADLLDWAALIQFEHEYIPKRTKENFGSFVINRPNMRDLTPRFSNQEQSLYPTHLDLGVLRVLVSGNVHPINKGYVFVWQMPSYKEAVFISEADPRLQAVKEMRLRNLDKMRKMGDTAIGIDEALKGSPFTVSD